MKKKTQNIGKCHYCRCLKGGGEFRPGDRLTIKKGRIAEKTRKRKNDNKNEK